MKREIRRDILDLRNQKTKEELEERSGKIKVNLFSTPEFKRAKKILFYMSVGSEVRTESMIEDALKLGKEIAVPAVDTENNALRVCELHDCDTELEPGTFGIPEPKKECRREVPAETIDLVIVPGIAFDRKGTRIGYGKGFYDRLLSSMPKARTLGLAYDFQLIQALPEEEHDIRVNKIVTESGVMKPMRAGKSKGPK